ncbi:MAG: TPM domain-containing protein [Candidatus Omnitrophota bacterium]
MKKNIILFIIAAALLQALSLNSYAEEPVYPDYIGYVNDYAGVLTNENKHSLTALAGDLERKTSAQMAIAIIDTTQPLDIESYAVRLFEKWGIGARGKDNGVLLLVALRDRKMRIEVGYGLEGAIPDALAKIIITNYITPPFKAGDLNAGIANGAVGIAKLVAKEYDVELSEFGDLPSGVPLPQEPTPLQSALQLIFSIIMIVVFLSFRMGFFWLMLMPGTHRRRGGYWHGGGYGGNSGGFSGGFGGFGGGLSGGGGASGGW